MIKILLFSFLTTFGYSASPAKVSCLSQATFDAIDESRDLIKHEHAKSNKLFDSPNNLEISFGELTEQTGSKLPKGIQSVVSVPITIKKSGVNVWDVTQMFMYGNGCMRDRIAEYDAGKKITDAMSLKK